MDKEYIFTEDPNAEIWQNILQFSYEANIKRYLTEHSFTHSEELINNISGSILQAYEYYSAAEKVNLQIKPLLLYYGTTNLLYGICNMMSGQINTITDHGMKIDHSQSCSCIGETKIKFLNPEKGGIHVLAKQLGYTVDLTKFGEWSVKEMFSSIPELQTNYLKCYAENFSNAMMLEQFNTPEGKLEKINISGKNVDEVKEQIAKIEGFDKSYLRPNISSKNDFLLLRHKINGEDISFLSYSEQPFLKVGHIKNQNLITLPQILYMYIALFALGSLCRYHPEIWSPFVKNDNSGEKLLVEKFLYYAKRLIPNYIVNYIYDCNMIYSNDKYKTIDTVKLVGEHQVQEMIKREIEEQNNVRMVMKYDF